MRQAALTPVQIQIYIILYYIYQVGHVYLSVDWSVDIFGCGFKMRQAALTPVLIQRSIISYFPDTTCIFIGRLVGRYFWR